LNSLVNKKLSERDRKHYIRYLHYHSACFPYSREAEIAKGRLEADGIEVFLRDNLTIDTFPLVSQDIETKNYKVEFPLNDQ
jgi:hypothetical protein